MSSPAVPLQRCADVALRILRDEPAVLSVEIDPAQHMVKIGYDDAALTADRVHHITQDASVALAESQKKCAAEAPGAVCPVCQPNVPSLEMDPSILILPLGKNGSLRFFRRGCRQGKPVPSWREKIPQFRPRQIEPAHDPDEWKTMLTLAATCGAATLAGACLSHQLGVAWAAPLAFGAAYVAGGWDAAHDVWELLKERTLDVHFLMLLVAAGAAAVGAALEGSILLFLFSFSGALEHFAQARTQREINSLLTSAPKEATRLRAGQEERIPVAELQPKDLILVRPGETIAADGRVIEGQSTTDESMLTGESLPQAKARGSQVFAGTLNREGALQIEVLKTAQESTLQKILDLISDAQKQKAPTQRFTDRFSESYTWLVLVASLLYFLFQWQWIHDPFAASFYHTMVLLVVASPCALVLSIPSAILAAIASGARDGILFKGGAAIELMAGVKVVAMDKTGTLTTGEFEVDSVETFGSVPASTLLHLAASLEALSEHPLARTIVRYAQSQGLTPKPVEKFQAVPGKGILGKIKGNRVAAGTREFVREQFPDTPLPDAVNPGKTEIWVVAGTPVGRIILGDTVRANAAAVISTLHSQNREVVMLTGDHEQTAAATARAVGITTWFSRLLPEDKVVRIRAYQQQGRPVAMVGDGVNDAPSLVTADVGIAMGARGSDAALEQADVVLMNDRLEKLARAFQLSTRARAVIRENLVVSLGTVLALIGLALGQKVNLTAGVVGHEGSTVLVCLNSLRLLLR